MASRRMFSIKMIDSANFYKCSIDEIYKDLNLLMEGE